MLASSFLVRMAGLNISSSYTPNAKNAWKYTNSDVATLLRPYTPSNTPLLCRYPQSYSVCYSIDSEGTRPSIIHQLTQHSDVFPVCTRRLSESHARHLQLLAKAGGMRGIVLSGWVEIAGAEDGSEKQLLYGVSKVIWRGNKQSKGRGGDEEVHEFATPFVANGWA